MNILITGIGGPTPRSIARTLKSSTERVRIIGTDANPKALGFFMDKLVDRSHVIPRASDPSYWPALKDLIAEEKIDLAFVQPEQEVIEWARYFEEHGEYPVNVLIPPLSLAEALVDKATMSDHFQNTHFIPKTLKIDSADPPYDAVGSEIGYPCWIRASRGSGGLGALKIHDEIGLRSWLYINPDLKKYTLSEYLPGRHLANQMLYYRGEYLKGALVECVEYVMAGIAPSKVTGNTSFGRFLNEMDVLSFSREAVTYLCSQLGTEPHGVLSFDMKEDARGHPKVTEINIRHMAYTGIMARVGFDLVHDTLRLLTEGPSHVAREPYFRFEKPYTFLRDVDVEPIIVDDILLRK